MSIKFRLLVGLLLAILSISVVLPASAQIPGLVCETGNKSGLASDGFSNIVYIVEDGDTSKACILNIWSGNAILLPAEDVVYADVSITGEVVVAGGGSYGILGPRDNDFRETGEAEIATFCGAELETVDDSSYSQLACSFNDELYGLMDGDVVGISVEVGDINEVDQFDISPYGNSFLLATEGELYLNTSTFLTEADQGVFVDGGDQVVFLRDNELWIATIITRRNDDVVLTNLDQYFNPIR